MTSKALTTANIAKGVLADVANLKKAVAKTSSQIDRPGRADFLTMGKDGVWSYGKSNLEVQEGAILAIDPTSFKTGYTCWSRYGDMKMDRKDEKLGTVMVALGADPIDPDTLERHTFDYEKDGVSYSTDWPWTPTREVRMVITNGEDAGVPLVYNVNSHGGVDVLDEYLEKLLAQLDEDPTKVVALIELGSTTYPHPKWGKTYKPDFEYLGWRALDDATPTKPEPEKEQDKPAADAGEEEPPKKPRRAAAKSDETSEQAGAEEGEAPKPTRTRRRPAA